LISYIISILKIDIILEFLSVGYFFFKLVKSNESFQNNSNAGREIEPLGLASFFHLPFFKKKKFTFQFFFFD
jgi:hypothetical protein